MDKLPMLQTLKVKFDGPEPYHNELTDHPIKLLAAPSLKEVSLDASRFMWNVRECLITPPSRWNQLLNLSIHASVGTRDLVDLLNQCRNLIACTLRPEYLHRTHTTSDPQAVAYLPSLKSLTFGNVDSTLLESVRFIFNSINAPSLASIAYSNSSNGPDYRRYMSQDPTYSCTIPFTSLLERSATVRKLALDLSVDLFSDIVQCLQIAVPITHLILGESHETRMRIRQIARASPSNTEPEHLLTHKKDFVDLNLLTIGKESSLLSSKKILLPNLEVLEAWQLSAFTDENLLEMISSRIDASSRGEASMLRYIRLQFDRPKQMDIVDELAKRAKAAGVNMKLELQYSLLTKPFGFGRLSPSFGLPVEDNVLSFKLESPILLTI
ncbi:hypothetical protein BDZ97DRAFT_1827307 [Flammula alnicola]|nr:hypothetical protein BDZ97DRAFT_1827307 [Flammula alnicola]